MTERYAEFARKHIIKTDSVSGKVWSKLRPQSEVKKGKEQREGHTA